jgi:hypothetical protein
MATRGMHMCKEREEAKKIGEYKGDSVLKHV